MNPDTKIELSLALVNATLNYLGTRPYAEVFQLVQEIQAQASQKVQSAESAGLSD